MVCIYQIRNISNNKIYIGSTKEFHKRKLRHIRELKKNKHHCIYLQRAYNKYGNSFFVFEILEKCTESELLNKEQEWINNKNPDYNIGGVGGGDNYTNHPNKEQIYIKITQALKNAPNPSPKYKQDNPNWKGGKTFFTCPKCGIEVRTSSKKTQKTCYKCKDISGEKNPFFGKKHSNEAKNKISKSKQGVPNLSCSKRCSINGIEYRSAAYAAKSLSIKPATLIYRLKSKNQKFKDWFYI